MLDTPKFHGSQSANGFLDWLTSIESIFFSARVPSYACVNLAARKFGNTVLAWWCALISRRSQVDEPSVLQLFSKICNLRREHNLSHSTRRLFTLLARNGVVESNHNLVARYLSGLRPDLQDKLQGFYFLSVEHNIPKAEAFENQTLRDVCRLQAAPQAGQPQGPLAGRQQPAPSGIVSPRIGGPSPQNTPQTASTSSTRSPPSSRPGVICLKCHQTSHMAAKSSSSRPKLANDTRYDVYDSEVYKNDEVGYEEEDLNGVQGQSLVTRPLLLTPSGNEEDWRRHNIFMTI